MSHPSMSHVGMPFVHVFGESLELFRKVLNADKDAQPFIVAGSGTLGWDMVASNLCEKGDHALVLHTGYFSLELILNRYFGDSFAECLEIYGANVTQLKAPIGNAPSLSEVEQAIRSKRYKLITITHVDTSTGVLSNVKAISELIRRISPSTLIVVDGVCSVGCETLEFSNWGLDIVLTASQKALGVPPGLSLLLASPRAIKTFQDRQCPSTSYFASWKKWLPIMRAYEDRKPMYFATPPVQLIYALQTSLKMILKRPLEERMRDHVRASTFVKDFVEKRLKLKTVPQSREESANGMTAIWIPEGIKLADLLPKLASMNVIFAGGLHKEIASKIFLRILMIAKYFRIGHMGVSVTDRERGDLEKALETLEKGLIEIGYLQNGFEAPSH
jgi:alanine-glyoxylate transaminase / serine-glyoxylate transaminase / serine-pyruvate transaminase